MTHVIQEDEEFMTRAVQFCDHVINYTTLLGLDPVKVQAFRSNRMLFGFALKNKEHFTEEGGNNIHGSLIILKASFADLIKNCKKSKNYKKSIGKVLGIDDIANNNKEYTAENPVNMPGNSGGN